MDALSEADALVADYLVFRGFAKALRSFEGEVAERTADFENCGFSVRRLTDAMRDGVKAGDFERLWRLWEYLDEKAFAYVPDGGVAGEASAVKSDVFKLLVVAQLRRIEAAGRGDTGAGGADSDADSLWTDPRACLESFFAHHGFALATADPSWEPWLGVLYTTRPSGTAAGGGGAPPPPLPRLDPRFAACFSASFQSLAVSRFENLLARALEHAPLPRLLQLASVQGAREDRASLAYAALLADRDRFRAASARLQTRVQELESDRAGDLRRAVEAAGAGAAPGSGAS